MSQRRVLVLVMAVMLSPWTAAAQTVCGQLFPLGVTAPDGGFVAGCANQYSAKIYTTAAGSLVPLALPACDGCSGSTQAIQFACEMTHGNSCCLSVSESLSVIPGNLSGPVIAGIANRFAADNDPRRGICYTDYSGNGARVGNMILIDPAAMRVTGFVRVFASDYTGGALTSIRIEVLDVPTPVRSRSWGQARTLYR